MLALQCTLRLGVILFLTCLCPTAPAAESSPASGKVTGRVINREGNGIADAQVTLVVERLFVPIATCKSNQDGRFEIADAPPNCRLRVFIDAEGYARALREFIDIFPGHTTNLGDTTISVGCVYHGKVLGPDGAPAANVRLIARLYQLRDSMTYHGSGYPLTTDAEGNFSTPPLPPCLIDIEVEPSLGCVRTWSRMDVIGPGETRRKAPAIQLTPEAKLEGFVTDTNGAPVANARISYAESDSDSTSTDALGWFQLHGSDAKTIGEARLSVSADGFSLYEEKSPSSQTPRKIVLAPCGYITGRAIDAETGEPVKIKSIKVCEVRRDANGERETYGCGEGRFEQPEKGVFKISVSTGGEKHLLFSGPGYQPSEEYIDAFDLRKGIDGFTIMLRKIDAPLSFGKQRIRGSIFKDGKRAAGVWVSLWQKRARDHRNYPVLRGRCVDDTWFPFGANVLTSENGDFLIDVEKATEEYCISARDREGWSAYSESLVVNQGAELLCNLQLQEGATLRGTVHDASASHGGLHVVAFASFPFLASAPVEPDGAFTIRNVPFGRIGLKVGHEGFIDADRRQNFLSGKLLPKPVSSWRRAKIITTPQTDQSNIELELPTSDTPQEPGR